jgi:hypothetical protein
MNLIDYCAFLSHTTVKSRFVEVSRSKRRPMRPFGSPVPFCIRATFFRRLSLMPSAAENRGPAVSFLHQEDAIALSKQLVKNLRRTLEVEKTPDVEHNDLVHLDAREAASQGVL